MQLWLAAGGTNNQQGGKGQEFGSSGPVALVLIIALFIAVVFLIRSMSKHLKKVPASFDPEPVEGAADAEAKAGTEAPEAGQPAEEHEKQDH